MKLKEYIPDVIHFIFGFKEQNYPFLFCYYLAVYSAYVVNKPKKIIFWYHYIPYGKWWDKLKEIKKIKFKKIDIPSCIGKKSLIKTAHKADIARMNILYRYGGIYMDIDTISIRPYKELLSNRVVLGKEEPKGICNAVMLTEPRSEFFRIWIMNYEKHFNPYGWGESSIALPEKIAIKHPFKLLLLSSDYFFIPSWQEIDKIFKLDYEIPELLTTLHLWESFSMKYLKNIADWDWAKKNPKTLYGRIILKLMNYNV